MSQSLRLTDDVSLSKPELQRKKTSFWKTFFKYKALTFMILPGLALLIVNAYLPMFGVFIAFKDITYRDGIFGSPWVGFENFEFLFASANALHIAKITVLYSLLFMVVNLVLAVAIALAMNEIRSRWLAKSYQTLMILPNFLSMVVVSYIVYAFLDPGNGFVNTSVLEWMGKDFIAWYNDPKYWPYILTLVNIWKGVGIGAVIYIAAIAGIDPEYYEAAIMDGATKWRQAWNITLPMIRPVVIIITILSMGGIFSSDFGLFYQVTLNSGALYDVTQTIDVFVYNALIRLNDIGMASAAALFQSVVGFIMVVAVNYVVKKINEEESLF